MAIAARYFDLVRETKGAYNHRLRLAESAEQRGIKPTVRLFATTVPTVRKAILCLRVSEKGLRYYGSQSLGELRPYNRLDAYSLRPMAN